MTIVLGSLVILLTLALGALLAFLFSRLDRAVVNNYAAIDAASGGQIPALTLGFDINPQAPADDQIAKARKEAAKLAAALPRGANSRIGYTETPGGRSAYKGVDHDPWTAAKIAEFHGWDGVRTGIPAGGVPEASVVAAPAAAAPSGKIELVPGKDYPHIEITDDMSDEEKRKARIANSKAKSAAMKAAKAAGVPAAAAAAPGVPTAAAPVAPAAVGIEAPKMIEISDDMSDEEKRKARIANSKAKSAFNKALKEAGIDPSSVAIDAQGTVGMPQGAAPVAAAAVAAPVQSGPTAVNIEAPVLIEITDDMPDDEKRKARIANSKAKSTFNKALKAAGIDPQTVEITEDGKVIIPGASAPAAVPAAEPAAPTIEPVTPADASGKVDLVSLGLEPPILVEITDDMSPDEKRQARIANSKAKSTFNKALKAAGIDPNSVDI
jgi:hypothetical protein